MSKGTVNKKESQKTDYSVLVLLLVGLIFLYYNVFRKDKVNDTESTSSEYQTVVAAYSVINIELNNKRAFNVSVRIYEKLPDIQLMEIANKVKSDIDAVSDRGVVFFLLPEMQERNGPWAAVDYNPEIKVRIIGKSIEDERKIRSGLGNVTDYVGLWMDDGIPGDAIIRIRNDKVEGFVLELISLYDPKPSNLATSIKRVKKDGKTIYLDLDNKGQYFVVEENGDLSMYDSYGFNSKYLKLR
ncbi:hypothetical protein GCM10027036_34740 [Flavihumibacter cheonanensis]|uniref:hypothetical protein n=1 Tax=Flavihumibacter cheonanensis TaxID=1442385 RepID=UPI001EF8B232|nr:hypothetical protein [Flavihumibacter cheonanensis]MCG7753479.1 hypothetical protein [Flavihumibacter cheonanensis]